MINTSAPSEQFFPTVFLLRIKHSLAYWFILFAPKNWNKLMCQISKCSSQQIDFWKLRDHESQNRFKHLL